VSRCLHSRAKWITVAVMPATTPAPISAAQAARRSGIPKRTILHAITTDALTATRMFGDTGPYVIDAADFDRWVDGRTETTA
jgi:hypothetical protein